MEDQEIIQLIREGKREKPIRFLYQEFPKIKQLVLKEGLTKEHAEEIFQNSLLLFIEKVENPAFVLSSKATTYLYGLNRFLTKNEAKSNRKTVHLEWTEANDFDDSTLSYDFEKEAKLNHLELILTQISVKCQKIFRLFYFEKKSMTDIAKTLNYSSTNSAKTQKYKCIEQAIKLSEESITLTSVDVPPSVRVQPN
ncbi:MAG: RNA polymerase sigma factor [Crocinitomicaceae bacterium]